MDSGRFQIEQHKTILVGPNEAGKSALLQAIQHLNPPPGVSPLKALRDYPRSKYNKIERGIVEPSAVRVVEAEFDLEEHERSLLPDGIGNDVTFTLWRNLDNSSDCSINGIKETTLGDLQKDLTRLASHADSQCQSDDSPSAVLKKLMGSWAEKDVVTLEKAHQIDLWLDETLPLIDENAEQEDARFDKLKQAVKFVDELSSARNALRKRVPVFVLFGNYFRVRPLIHLKQFAQRVATKSLDDDRYDYGNVCLLKLLGFDANELSTLGASEDPDASSKDAMENYRDMLDRRQYQLNAASVELTREIQNVWNPDHNKGEASRLLIKADGQYLKVVVEDELGVEVEIDQRSEGFQWLVSFFVVFFAEAMGKHENVVLLLDEPGVSLHALKQREFRKTISRLAEANQTLYTTHSPFLVGPDELDLVRVVEMKDREEGTKVHTSITANDPAALLPLQEALGYDLAQSLFTQKRNLVLEGLTDYWYVESVSQLLRSSDQADLNKKIALIPAGSASKVGYFATILHAQNFKVAALLDSDAAGDEAASQDTLVHTLGNKRILRTKDHLVDQVPKAEIEDLLRVTLVKIAKAEGWDVEEDSTSQSERPIVNLLSTHPGFSKYLLAKAFVRWSRDHTVEDLTADEVKQWTALIGAINKSLK